MRDFGLISRNRAMSYVSILQGLDVKNDALFFRLGKIDCISHFCSINSQILRYVYQYILYQWIATGTSLHMDVKHFVSDHLLMHKRALGWYFNP